MDVDPRFEKLTKQIKQTIYYSGSLVSMSFWGTLVIPVISDMDLNNFQKGTVWIICLAFSGGFSWVGIGIGLAMMYMQIVELGG